MIKYLISQNGLGIAVGLIGDKQEAQETMTLAENIFGVNVADYLFSGLIFMRDFKQFKKFLILREYFKIWDRHFTRNRVSGRRDKSNVMQFTRRAIRQAKLVLDSSVDFEEYMRRMHGDSYVLNDQ